MYLYEKREWARSVLFSMLVSLPLVLLILSATAGSEGVLEGSPWELLGGIALFFSVICLCRGSVYVALSSEDLRVQVGHIPMAQRTVPVSSVVKIERLYLPWYRSKPQKGFWVKTERYSATWGEAFTVYVQEGKPFTVQLQDREGFIKAITRLSPKLTVV